MSEANNGALHGIRVLDLTRVLAGPYCTMFLGDLGAEVVKVEQPGVGDDTRGWGRPLPAARALIFSAPIATKKASPSIFKSADGIALVRQLAERADVLIENFRPGAMERLGLGEKQLREKNPRLVYASLSGFGADGPMADIPGYDLIVQAWGGLMSITGSAESGPLKVGVAIIDLVAGLMLGKSIVAALYAREKIGVGQKLDTSLFEAEVAALINAGSNYLIGGQVPGRWGNAHPTIVPYQSFQTADSFLVLGRRQRNHLAAPLPGAGTAPISPTIRASPRMPTASRIA